MSYIPPSPYTGTPLTRVVAPRTTLHRIGAYKYPVTAFKPVPAHRYFGGGRFDATADDTYEYLYAALTVVGAIAERLLRDRPRDPSGRPTVLTRSELAGLHACSIQVSQELKLVDLASLAGLAAVEQDPWLTTVESPQYAQTRHWGHQIRSWAPDAHGFIWRSRRDPGDEALILFEDRVPAGTLSPGAPPVRLDTTAGRAFLSGKLPWGYSVAP